MLKFDNIQNNTQQLLKLQVDKMEVVWQKANKFDNLIEQVES